MQETRISQLELIKNPLLITLLEFKCWNLLGIPWEKRIEYWVDPATDDLIFQYE